MDYAEIKFLAKEQKVRVTDLIVLAPQNDPFYIGTDSDRLWCDWFYELWQRFNYGAGVHIRRIHYQIVSQKDPVKMPNGKPYENTEECWHRLVQASKTARYMGLVDPLALDDRRNPPPQILAEFAGEGGDIQLINESFITELMLPRFPELPDYQILGFVGEQDYLVEIWCEKSTMNDVLVPLCRTHNVNLVTGLGELSITAVARLVQRVADLQKPTRILYVSDFDPAGECMPVSVARKIEFFLQEQDQHDVQLHHVVLTKQQTINFSLPRTPIKDTERRKNGFETRHGQGATELDALEALHPGELKRILVDYITRFYDPRLVLDVSDAKDALYDELEAIRGPILDEYEPQIEKLRQEYGDLSAQISDLIAGYTTRARQLWQAISDELEEEMPDIDDFPVPEPQEANEIDGALFDSSRGYLEQLEAYRGWRNGGPGEQERQNDLV
jgi:hypothetical protein